jgi:general stress protein CsbA
MLVLDNYVEALVFPCLMSNLLPDSWHDSLVCYALLPCYILASPYKSFTWKTYALGISYEGFTFIKVYVSESRTGARQKGETSEQGSSPHSLALHSQWRVWGRANTPSCLLARLGELHTRRGELVQNSTCIIDVLSQKSSSLNVPRHMASLVIIENLKISLVASIHK